MRKGRKTAILLALVLVAGLGFAGCKRRTPGVDAGTFTVQMPGTPQKSTQQLPLNLLDIGIDSSLTMTVVESQDDNQNYVALSVDWREAVASLKQVYGENFNVSGFYNAVIDNCVQLLMLGANVSEGRDIEIDGQTGKAYTFIIAANAEADPPIEKTVQGDYYVYTNENMLMMTVYYAEESAYDQKAMRNFHESLQINAQ